MPQANTQYAPAVSLQQGRATRRRRVPAGACGVHAGFVQGGQAVGKTLVAPVQHMVVGQHAAVELGRREARQVVRMHAVLDALAGPGLAAGGDGGFQVDDAEVRLMAIQFRQRIAPGIGIVHRQRQRAEALLGQGHIVARRFQISLVDARVGRMRQDLVDAAPAHDVAAEKQGEGLCACAAVFRHVFRVRQGGRQ